MLYGVPPASVKELECNVHGADACTIDVRWDDAMAARVANPEEHITALEGQLVALNDRFESMYRAAGDLIADDDLASTLEKITERSTTAVRAQRYLLVVRPEPEAELEIHHRGFAGDEALAVAEEVLTADATDVPDTWLLADIRSHNHHYGRLLALFDHEASVFPTSARRSSTTHATRRTRSTARSLSRGPAARTSTRPRCSTSRARSPARTRAPRSRGASPSRSR